MAIHSVLKQLGFSDNEARVYIGALELGTASAQDIAKTAGVKRTTAYSVLEYLVERGVVGKTQERGKKRFVAEPPEKLEAIINQLHHRLKEALPELEAVYNANENKPKITFYEGEEAIQNVYDDTLREKPTEILEWNTDLYFERFPKNHNYIDKRVELGIRARRIAGKGSQWDLKHQRYDKIELAETLVVPKDHFWPDIEVNVYGNKVAFMNYAENMSVIIESKPIAEAMKQAYELSWIGAQSIRQDKHDNQDYQA